MVTLVHQDPSTTRRPGMVFVPGKTEDHTRSAILVAKALFALGREFKQKGGENLGFLLPCRNVLCWDETDDSKLGILYPPERRYDFIFLSRKLIHSKSLRSQLAEMLSGIPCIFTKEVAPSGSAVKHDSPLRQVFHTCPACGHKSAIRLD